MLHSLLLVPADKAYLQRMERLRPLLEQPGFDAKKQPPGRDREMSIWRAFGLSILEYRQGKYARSKQWAEVAMSFKDSRNYINGALDPLYAMACHRLGDEKSAKIALERSRLRVEKAFSPELPAAYEPFGQYQGFWWDWIITRLLYREAEALIQGGKK
jgi:hypothetical protein